MSTHQFIRLHNLKKDEMKIIETIENSIRDNNKITIAEVARQHFTSTSSIVNLAKKLGFDGYSDMVFSMSRPNSHPFLEDEEDILPRLIDRYRPEDVDRFCGLLEAHKARRIFVMGIGYSDITADYFVQKLSSHGFLAFRGPHFDIIDYASSPPSLFIAISKSGETNDTIVPAVHAKEKGYNLVTFTSNGECRLAKDSDIAFVIEESSQLLLGQTPEYFFGKCILALEAFLTRYIMLYDLL